MNLKVLLLGPEGERELHADSFPQAVHGEGLMRSLSQDPQGGAALFYLGLTNEGLYVQPGSSGGSVWINREPVRESRWVQDGDTLRCADTEILCELDGARATLRPRALEPQNDTQPPVSVSPPQPSPDSARIEPVAFQPSSVQPTRKRRVHPATLFLGLVFIALAGVLWYLLTARSVELRIDPHPESMRVRGALNFALGGRYLLRAGSYVLEAEKAGYERLNAPFEVTQAPSQDYRFHMKKLPGYLVLSTGDVEGAAIVVDGQRKGTTPAPPIELSPGAHEIRLTAERYKDHLSHLVIEGAGVTQELTVQLTPLWAPVSVDSEPSGAVVWVDGKELGPTPLTIELLEGNYALELRAPKHDRWQQRILVEANQPLEIPTVKLTPSKGVVQLATSPSRANVTVDGDYVGQTPLDLPLVPDQTHRIQVSRAGYDSSVSSIRLEAGETRTLNLTLAPRNGELRIESRPQGAEVWIDGKRHGSTPLHTTLLATTHEIEIKKPGYVPYRTKVKPRPGFTEVVTASLRETSRAKAAPPNVSIKTRDAQVLRLIPAGQFTMGASRREQGRRSNETLRKVELTRPFYIGVKEVTNEQFRRFSPDHSSGSYKGMNLNGDDQPVVNVTWEDAARYCNWLSAKEGLPPAYASQGGKLIPTRPMNHGYRLPTEAEWAWSARFLGGSGSLRYPWGEGFPPPTKAGNYADASASNVVGSVLNAYRDGHAVSAPVGSFPPNALGIHDLGGNVAEWTNDFYAVYSTDPSTTARDPMGPKRGRHHVIRGSSWRKSTISDLRLARRDYGEKKRPDVGFRIARFAQQSTSTALHAPIIRPGGHFGLDREPAQ